jgi:acetyl esterase/lipase
MRAVAATSLLLILFLTSCSLSGQTVQRPAPTPTQSATVSIPSTPFPTSTQTITAAPTDLESNAIQEQSPLFDQEKLGTVDRDVTYCMWGNYPVLMDVYYPNAMNGPWPVVINIHGGAWALNSQRDGQGLQIQPQLNALGFLVVSVDYRNSTQWMWPAMIEDAKCAVRFLRAHAQEYNLDPNRIGVVGDSVGGQLALLLALTDSSAGWDVGEDLGYSSQVQAVVDFFGPTDLTSASVSTLVRKWGLNEFGDIRFMSPVLVAASPITYVNPYTPPILIFQGNVDETVPLEQSQEIYDGLLALGAPVSMVIVKNGGHELPLMYNQIPTTAQVYLMAIAFFDERLGEGAGASGPHCWSSVIEPAPAPPDHLLAIPGCVQDR